MGGQLRLCSSSTSTSRRSWRRGRVNVRVFSSNTRNLKAKSRKLNSRSLRSRGRPRRRRNNSLSRWLRRGLAKNRSSAKRWTLYSLLNKRQIESLKFSRKNSSSWGVKLARPKMLTKVKKLNFNSNRQRWSKRWTKLQPLTIKISRNSNVKMIQSRGDSWKPQLKLESMCLGWNHTRKHFKRICTRARPNGNRCRPSYRASSGKWQLGNRSLKLCGPRPQKKKKSFWGACKLTVNNLSRALSSKQRSWWSRNERLIISTSISERNMNACKKSLSATQSRPTRSGPNLRPSNRHLREKERISFTIMSRRSWACDSRTKSISAT